MARYNSVIPVNSIASAPASPLIPQQGVLNEFTASGFTTQLPNPVSYPGVNLLFYNASAGTVTLSTSSTSNNNILGAGAGAVTYGLGAGNSISLVSDGASWISLSAGGGPVAATTLSASSTVTLSPTGAVVTISPTGAAGQVVISSPTANSSAGTMDNVIIGGTTPQAGNFTQLKTPSTAITTTAWTTAGYTIAESARTLTDSTSTGTVAANYVNALNAPTLAASNAGVTFTNAATLYVASPVAGTNVTITNNYAILSPGNVNFGGIQGTPIGSNSQSTGAFTTVSANNGTDASSTTSGGTVTITGGLAVSKTLYATTLYAATHAGNVTMNGTVTFTGTGGIQVQGITETATDTALSSNTITGSYQSGNVFYVTGSASGNMTFNFTNVPTASESTTTFNVMLPQGGTGYIPTTVNVNGSGVTIRWQYGVTPTPSSSKTDFFNFTFLYRSGSFTCYASAALGF